MPAFSNLGDEPGETLHSGHKGMKVAAHGKRARGGKADEDEREHDAKGGRIGLAAGGKTDSSMSDTGAKNSRIKGNVYNAVGSPEMAEATDETPGFGRGGRSKRKSGGSAEGHADGHRMDRHQRRANGGSTRTPYSTGSVLSPPTDDRPGRGYEGGKPA